MATDTRIQFARSLIASRVKRLRAEAGLEVSEVARRAKIHRTYVHGIEKGEVNVTLDVLASVLSACGVALDEFLTGLRQSDESEPHQELHRMLSAIVNSGNADLIHGIRINLEAISEKAARLKRARTPASAGIDKPTKPRPQGEKKKPAEQPGGR